MENCWIPREVATSPNKTVPGARWQLDNADRRGLGDDDEASRRSAQLHAQALNPLTGRDVAVTVGIRT